MRRYFYAGFLIVAILITVLFFYRTNSPPELATRGEFGGMSLRIEYATTDAARAKGLGGRASIPSDYGMLFVYEEDGKYGFWMKDTLVSLDMFWLDDKGRVVSIVQGVTPSSYPNVFYPSVPARYVLETVAGFAEAHSIATGTQLYLKNLPTVSE